MVERERIIEIVVAVGSVLAMLSVMLWIGFTHGNDNGLTEVGGQLLVAAIVGFILLLTTVGIGLAFYLNDPEDGLETEDSDVDGAVWN